MLKDWTIINTSPWEVKADGGMIVCGNVCTITVEQITTWERTVNRVVAPAIIAVDAVEATETEDAIEAVIGQDAVTMEESETDKVSEISTIKHQRTSFFEYQKDTDGKLLVDSHHLIIVEGSEHIQTDVEWHANIAREVKSLLDSWNQVELSPVDITSQVVIAV